MSEFPKQIELLSGPSGINSHKLDLQSEQSFRGGLEEKHRVKGIVSAHGEEKNISLIKRNNEGAYLIKWKLFKEIGLPVIPTLRMSPSDPDKIFLTDLTANGSELYGKSLRFRLNPKKSEHDYNKDFEPKTDYKNLFTEISLRDIEAEANRIADIASKSKVLLASDDPFELLITPNGDWKLIIIDLAYASIARVYEEEECAKINKSSVEFFIEIMKDLQNFF